MTGDPVATLQLAPARIVRTLHDGNITRHPESQYLDFIVNGVPFSSAVEEADDLVTALNRPWLHCVGEAIEVLLGRRPDPDLAPGRIPLLMCKGPGIK